MFVMDVSEHLDPKNQIFSGKIGR